MNVSFWKRPAARIAAAALSIVVLVVTVALVGKEPTEQERREQALAQCATDAESSISPLFSSPVQDASLTDIGQKPVMLHELAGESFTVVAFCSYKCPCSDGYADRLRELQRAYSDKGVRFVAIHSNADETTEGMKSYIDRKQYPLPVYRDRSAIVADMFHALVTPEVFVFAPDWKLRYHGRIDDDKSGLYVGDQSLKNALDTLLTKAPLIEKEKLALGCAITRKAG